MNLGKVLTITICIFAQSGPVLSNWNWASDRMLVAEGISMYADRFEILPTDFCSGIKMRAWAKVGDKASNQIIPGDFLEMQFLLDDALVLNRAQVLGVHYDFDEDFDILYLNFGEWDWSFVESFMQYPDQALLVIYDYKKAQIDSNSWVIGSLSEELRTMRSNCKVLDLGGSV